jgi:Flp pilus assembly protein TadD
LQLNWPQYRNAVLRYSYGIVIGQIMKRNNIYFALALALAVSNTVAAWAQEADEDVLDQGAAVAPSVIEPAGSRELREAMRRIAVRPNDAEALFDAGNASLMLGDAAAALNFFTRAANLRPTDGRIKAGLGAATVRTENPFEALRLFDEAVKLGISERAIAVDRALAFDLLGNFARAQQDYKLARTAAVSEQLIIQQSISLSLSGAKTEADNMLVPLLQKNNLDAWRARAFMLAARGEFKESTRVTAGFLDATSARKMESYLRLMPQLTGAQQVAAIHFGHFPQSFEIGRDSAAVVRTAANTPQPATGSGRLVPSGAPLGPASNAKAAIDAEKARKDREAAEQAAKLAESKRAADTARAQEASRTAEQQRKAEAIKQAEVQRVAEAQKLAEAQRIAEAQRLAEMQRQSEAQRLADAQKQAEAQRLAEMQRQVEAQRVADAQKQAEAEKLAQIERERLAAVAPPVLANPEAAKIASSTKIAEASNSQVEIVQGQEMPPPQSARPLVDVALPSNNEPATDVPASTPPSAVSAQPVISNPTQPTPLPAAEIATAPANIPASQPSVGPTAPNIAANMPERPAIANAPSDTVIASNTAPASTAWVQGVGSEQTATTTDKPSPTPATTPAETAPAPVKAASSGFDLGDVVASIEIPESEQQRTVAAVDLKKLKSISEKNAAKAKLAEAEKKAKADEQAQDKTAKAGAKGKGASDSPSRHWVQVATGSDLKGLTFDWRRLTKKHPELFKGRDGWTSEWGKSNRLVVGPFDDLKSAKKWESEFRKAGGNGFAWVSDKGQDVQRLKSK